MRRKITYSVLSGRIADMEEFKQKVALLNVRIPYFVTTLRIDKAKRLLRESDLSVQAISAAVGYCSCTSFIRRFRLMTGKTPGEYRLSPEEK